MNREIQLANYMMIGSVVAMSGHQLRLDDKFKRDGEALCVVRDEASGSDLHRMIDGILNLDGNVLLLLGSADPEDRESKSRTFTVAKLIAPDMLEVCEESLLKRIQAVGEDALAQERNINLARIESVLGALRADE